jgi:hypothetical protein
LNRQRSVAVVKEEEVDLSPVQLHGRKCLKTTARGARCPHTTLLPQYTAVDIKWNPYFVFAVNETLTLHHGNIAERSHDHQC